MWCPFVRVPVLEILELVQRLFPVEELDVLGLRRGKPAHGPAQMHEVRLDRVRAAGASRSRSGRLFALRVLHGLQAVTTFVQSLVPPRERGIRWSRVSDSRGLSSIWRRPQYWQR